MGAYKSVIEWENVNGAQLLHLILVSWQLETDIFELAGVSLSSLFRFGLTTRRSIDADDLRLRLVRL